MRAERRFRAMGSDVLLLADDAPTGALDMAERLLHALEREWSRFLPGSALSRLNAGAGHPVVVPPRTYDVVSRAVDAWWSTAGWFDPTVHDALVAAGYDRSFERLDGTASVAAPVPGCARIELDPWLRAVTLPVGVRLDLGGIGKGRAADLVVEALLAAGAAGACASVGGDVRCTGGPWPIGVEDPHEPSTTLAVLVLADGAVATSSRLRRTWGERSHHLLDPTTGRPSTSDVVAATAVAGDATEAEVAAKVALLTGEPVGATILVTVDGTVHRCGVERFLA